MMMTFSLENLCCLVNSISVQISIQTTSQASANLQVNKASSFSSIVLQPNSDVTNREP